MKCVDLLERLKDKKVEVESFYILMNLSKHMNTARNNSRSKKET